MPFDWSSAVWCYPATAVADGVAFELDWMTPTVADAVAFLLFEWVMTGSGEQKEPMAVADVLHVGEASLLAVGALAIGLVDLVFVDELAIDGSRVFAFGYSARHVPPVSMAEVAHGYLLDESFGR